jgi:hypothetical protein
MTFLLHCSTDATLRDGNESMSVEVSFVLSQGCPLFFFTVFFAVPGASLLLLKSGDRHFLHFVKHGFLSKTRC